MYVVYSKNAKALCLSENSFYAKFWKSFYENETLSHLSKKWKKIRNWKHVVDQKWPKHLTMFSESVQFLSKKNPAFHSHLKNWKLDLEHLKLYLFAQCSAGKHWSFLFKDLIYYLSNGTEFNTQLFSHWSSFLAEVNKYVRQSWTVKELKCPK